MEATTPRAHEIVYENTYIDNPDDYGEVRVIGRRRCRHARATAAPVRSAAQGRAAGTATMC